MITARSFVFEKEVHVRWLPLLLIAGLVLPASAVAQSWSDEEQELISQVEACWQADDDGAYEGWVRVCNPANDMVSWWTGEPAPVTKLKWWEGTEVDWHERYVRVSWDVRPINIRFYGDVGVIYYYWTSQLRETDGGALVNEQGGSVEMYRKAGDRWEYLGGMGFPITGS